MAGLCRLLRECAHAGSQRPPVRLESVEALLDSGDLGRTLDEEALGEAVDDWQLGVVLAGELRNTASVFSVLRDQADAHIGAYRVEGRGDGDRLPVDPQRSSGQVAMPKQARNRPS
jgi:hypothetical protein